ncbi:MAG: glycosyltransferase family 2 protein [Frankiales bacterium]|nr:glycosyltransferase family 2 protein [Frankiales bacterium]
MTAPRLSVVLPTYQRAELLDRCLSALARSDLDSFEVVAVDDGSTDRTSEVLRDHAGKMPLIALTQQRNAGPAAARNRGLGAAAAPLVLFVDDDVVVTSTLLRQHVDLHDAAADDTLCVLGRVDWHPDLRITPFMHWLDRSGLQFAYDTWLTEGVVDPPYAAFYTANLSIPRALLVAADGFDERFPFPAYEDMELAFRLAQQGLRMEYRPAALAYHSRAIDLPTFRRRTAMVARSAALLRTAAPDFPLDDAGLVGRHRRRRERLRLAALAVLTRSEQARSEHYWAQVANAYVVATHEVSQG